MKVSNISQSNQGTDSALWYFAFGPEKKSSLLNEYSRQNKIQYIVDPQQSALESLTSSECIIQTNSEVFRRWEPLKSNISVIFMGEQSSLSQEQKIIKKQYQLIGRCKSFSSLTDYEGFRKKMYPNLIFLYGPNSEHSTGAASTLAFQSGYRYISEFPESANEIISKLSKTQSHCTFSNLFTNPKEIKILQSRFNVRIIHFRYDRTDYPNDQAYFDREFEILAYLEGKDFFLSLDAHNTPEFMMDRIGEFLCPKLTFINANNQPEKIYARKYAEDKGIQVISIFEIQEIEKVKGIPISSTVEEKVKKVTSIIFNDLDAKEVVLMDFPWHTSDVRLFENVNRKFSTFVDLDPSSEYLYSDIYTSNIYFLETQRRVQPDTQFSLVSQIEVAKKYWIVNGPQGVGKSSVAKFLESQYAIKSIDFQTYLVSLKEKLANPDDGGEEVPLKKIIAHFKDLIHSTENDIEYVLDSFPYGGSELEQWVAEIGAPFVINLKAEDKEVIKRQRKKAEADIAAEVSEEEAQKVTELQQKQREWIEKLNQICNDATIYNIDFNQSVMLCERLLTSILEPRVFLIQSNPTLIYQNAAIKNDCCLINLAINPDLEEVKKISKKSTKRNVVICNYRQTQDKLVSEDLYWIEKNIGKIRYLAIWQGEDRSVQEEKIHLERPVEEKKVREPVEGEEEEQAPEEPADEEEEGAKKKQLDIYAFEWTKPLNYKNLSQWYFKLKKNITEIENSPEQTYNKFGSILEEINSNPSSNFYQVVKP